MLLVLVYVFGVVCDSCFWVSFFHFVFRVVEVAAFCVRVLRLTDALQLVVSTGVVDLMWQGLFVRVVLRAGRDRFVSLWWLVEASSIGAWLRNGAYNLC